MNGSVSRYFRVGLLSLGLVSGAAGVAFGQPGTADNNAGGASVRQASPPDTRHDRDFDWGLLGLAGLAGLAGLIPLFNRRDHDRHDHRRDAAAGRGTARA